MQCCHTILCSNGEQGEDVAGDNTLPLSQGQASNSFLLDHGEAQSARPSICFLVIRSLRAIERSGIMEIASGSDRWLCSQVRVGDSEPGEADTYPLSARV